MSRPPLHLLLALLLLLIQGTAPARAAAMQVAMLGSAVAEPQHAAPHCHPGPGDAMETAPMPPAPETPAHCCDSDCGCPGLCINLGAVTMAPGPAAAPPPRPSESASRTLGRPSAAHGLDLLRPPRLPA